MSASYPGDLVVLCLGDRYAPNQFLASAVIDDDRIGLVTGGGVAGRVDASQAAMKSPTRLRPLGLLTGACGQVLDVADHALPAMPPFAQRDRVTGAVLVVGCGIVQAVALAVAAFATRGALAALHGGVALVLRMICALALAA